jgi:hypothetical protein
MFCFGGLRLSVFNARPENFYYDVYEYVCQDLQKCYIATYLCFVIDQL